MSAPLLEVSGLTVRHRRDLIVDGVDLTLARGEALGLAGESGCGKSTTALSLMRLLPPAATMKFRFPAESTQNTIRSPAPTLAITSLVWK